MVDVINMGDTMKTIFVAIMMTGCSQDSALPVVQAESPDMGHALRQATPDMLPAPLPVSVDMAPSASQDMLAVAAADMTPVIHDMAPVTPAPGSVPFGGSCTAAADCALSSFSGFQSYCMLRDTDLKGGQCLFAQYNNWSQPGNTKVWAFCIPGKCNASNMTGMYLTPNPARNYLQFGDPVPDYLHVIGYLTHNANGP